MGEERLRPKLTARVLLVTSCASLLLLVSAGSLLFGGFATLFSLSPATDMADSYVLARVGPPLLGGGAFGMRLARRLWRLRKPSDPAETSAPEPFSSPLRELAWVLSLIALGFAGTWLLLISPPWSSTPVTSYGASYGVKVVPLRIFLGVVVTLLAIRLLPRLAALALSRQIFKPMQVASLATAGALSMALLACAHFAGFPSMPHTFVLLVLDVALASAFGVVAIESIHAAAPHG